MEKKQGGVIVLLINIYTAFQKFGAKVKRDKQISMGRIDQQFEIFIPYFS